MLFPAESIARVETEITDLVADLCELLSSTPDNEKEQGATLDWYIKRVARIGLISGREGLSSLQDVCFVYKQILDKIREQNVGFSEYLKERFELWPMLVLSLLKCPIDDDLYVQIVEFYEDPIWPQDTVNFEMGLLRGEKRTISNSSVEADACSSEQSAAPYTGVIAGSVYNDEYTDACLTLPYNNMTLEALQQEVIETMADLLMDLNDYAEGQVAAEYADSLHLCADRTELVAITVATMGFMGLMDVCQYFQYSMRELAKSEESISDRIMRTLEEWPGLVIAYLCAPGETECSKSLVDYISSISWTPDLLEEEETNLYEQLSTDKRVYSANDVETEDDNEKSLCIDGMEVGDIEEPEFLRLNGGLLSTESTQERSAEEKEQKEKRISSGSNDNELISIIKSEFVVTLSDLQECLIQIFKPTTSSEEKQEKYQKFKSIVERLKLASESVGLTGLAKVLENMTTNVGIISLDTDSSIETSHTALQNCPDLLLTYLEDISNVNSCHNLANTIFNAGLPIAIEGNIDQLVNELSNPAFICDEDEQQRPTQAHKEDVNLQLPEDVNQQLLDTLLHELPGQTSQFTDAISRLLEGKANLEVLEVAQRIAHTLKGSANTVGVKGIATITHHVEDILTAFVKHEKIPGAALAETLMSAADVLEAMSEALLGIGAEPDNAQSVLQNILDWANRIDQQGITEADHFEVKPEMIQEEGEVFLGGNKQKEPPVQTLLRVPAELMDELLRLVGETLTLSGQLQERIQRLTEQTHLEQQQNKLFQQLCFELEQITDIKGMITREATGTYNEVFDSLELDQYNELHTITHRLVESATDARELTNNIEDGLSSLKNLLIDQDRLQKETQEVVLRTRMIPVRNIVPRLQRAVRQTCRFTDKHAILDVQGADTLVDSDILDDLVDPLMHVIRNAIDHGIESPHQRLAMGKEEKGLITLRFARKGNHIQVECSDDGAGLDFERIKAQAINKQLINGDNEVSEEELTRFIWLPGFTTKDKTTQVSGRGIGMDAVHTKIASMKGTLNVVSLPDVGTTVQIQLPLTLISMHALLVSAYNQQLAISSRGVEQILPPGDGFVESKGNKVYFHLEDEIYEFTELESLLNIPYSRKSSDRTVLLVRDETGVCHAVSLEKVVASKDVVVKQLGKYLPDIAGIEGATILGDGGIAPVIDLPSLLSTASVDYINPWFAQLDESGSVTDAPYALIVDDSLSARRSLAEYVKDLGYEILTAKDGLEAIDVIATRRPDIMLVDFEMPRMNGVELTAHVRADENTKDMPIIMITSRSTEKHQTMATSAGVNVYLTKPYSEDVLMHHIHSLYQEPRRTA